MIKMSEETSQDSASEVKLLKDRISALENRLIKNKSESFSIRESIKKISNFIFNRLFSKDNIGLILSLVSIIMSSCVVAYLVLK